MIAEKDIVLKYMAEGGGISEMQNPITRSMVKLNPPLVCSDGERFKSFERFFDMWCEAMWMLGYNDPTELTSRHWVAADSALNTPSTVPQG